jgi:glycerophosphoryl diester phosphodiesterase
VKPIRPKRTAAGLSHVEGPHGPVALKVHGCQWSGQYPENSLAAIGECLTASVARAEFDLRMLRDQDFVLLHDDELQRADGSPAPANAVAVSELLAGAAVDQAGGSPALLSDTVALLGSVPQGTIFEIDAKDDAPWPWARVEELAGLLEPVRDRIVLAGCADANLRRMARVAPEVPLGFDPLYHFDWLASGELEPLAPPAGAYGYRDADPSARQPDMLMRDYLRHRFRSLLDMVPGIREVHLRLQTFERLLDDDFGEVVAMVHERGLLLDVWTLDRGTPHWRSRFDRALAAGVDMVTTNTAPVIVAELSRARMLVAGASRLRDRRRASPAPMDVERATRDDGCQANANGQWRCHEERKGASQEQEALGPGRRPEEPGASDDRQGGHRDGRDRDHDGDRPEVRS